MLKARLEARKFAPPSSACLVAPERSRDTYEAMSFKKPSSSSTTGDHIDCATIREMPVTDREHTAMPSNAYRDDPLFDRFKPEKNRSVQK